jgi:hypothetical protein
MTLTSDIKHSLKLSRTARADGGIAQNQRQQLAGGLLAQLFDFKLSIHVFCCLF